MKVLETGCRIILGSFLPLILGLCISPQSVFCQTDKLGIVQYTPPQGWNRTLKENVVGFSKLDQATGAFCIVTLYGAMPGTSGPAGDFSRDWNKLVVGSMKADANPQRTQLVDGWT